MKKTKFLSSVAGSECRQEKIGGDFVILARLKVAATIILSALGRGGRKGGRELGKGWRRCVGLRASGNAGEVATSHVHVCPLVWHPLDLTPFLPLPPSSLCPLPSSAPYLLLLPSSPLLCLPPITLPGVIQSGTPFTLPPPLWITLQYTNSCIIVVCFPSQRHVLPH